MKTTEDHLKAIAATIDAAAYRDSETGDYHHLPEYTGFVRGLAVKTLKEVFDDDHLWLHFPHGKKIDFEFARKALAAAWPYVTAPGDAVVHHSVFTHPECEKREAFRQAMYAYFDDDLAKSTGRLLATL